MFSRIRTVAIDPPLLESLLTMATFVEARDAYTGGHAWRVSQYARSIAESLGLGRHDVFVIQLGGLVHDLGKVGVSDIVLNKKGPLDEAEFALMREHPRAGVETMGGHPLLMLVREAILEHHERYDGGGYPGGGNAETLSMTGRILAVADAFDAMTSTRAYRPGMTAADALAIIDAESGRQFDPRVAGALHDLAGRGGLDHILGHAAEVQLMLTCPVCGPVIAPPEGAHDGDVTVCPACRGNFSLHRSGESFELELESMSPTLYMPRPDRRAVRSILAALPSRMLKTTAADIGR